MGLLFDLLGKTGSREGIRAANNYLSAAVYKMYRMLYQANPENNPEFFSLSQRQFQAGIPDADMKCSEAELAEALAAHSKEKGQWPPMGHDDLAQGYPGLYQSLLQLTHTCGERFHGLTAGREPKKP